MHWPVTSYFQPWHEQRSPQSSLRRTTATATVRAELVDQTVSSRVVAERDETLRQQLHAHRRAVVLWQLVHEQRRNPIGAEHPSHRRGWTGRGQQIVLFFPEHGANSAVNGLTLCARILNRIMPSRVELCKIGDVAAGEVRRVEAAGLTLAVYNVDGDFYTTDDHCTRPRLAVRRVCRGRCDRVQLSSRQVQHPHRRSRRPP